MLCPQPNCRETGWPQLADLCLAHYRDLVFAKIWHDFIAAEEAYFASRDSIYGVEVAMGLRPSLKAFYEESYKRAKPAPPGGRANRTSNKFSFELIADEGDLETDI